MTGHDPTYSIAAVAIVSLATVLIGGIGLLVLAAAMRAPGFEVQGDHGAVIVRAREFNTQLLAALDRVRDPRAAATT